MTEKCPFQFDLMNPMTHNESLPFEAFATLRQQCPVSYQSGAPQYGGDFWAITKRADLDYISKNPNKFSSSANLAHPQPGGNDPESLEIMRQLIINMDPPNHVKYRRVVRNAFTGKAVDALEPLMREFAKEIIDNVASSL
jgi:cytochrome P450